MSKAWIIGGAAVAAVAIVLWPRQSSPAPARPMPRRPVDMESAADAELLTEGGRLPSSPTTSTTAPRGGAVLGVRITSPFS